ncbi:MAG: ribonuclease R [Cytophagaceae bacterium]|nr:ribonuclease R [Cytophagaceae bacterium]
MKQNSKQADEPKLTKEDRFLSKLKGEIYSFFDLNYEQSFNLNQVHKAFSIKDRHTKELFEALIEDLTEAGKLLRHSDGSYTVDTGLRYRTGRVEHTNPRFAFVVADGFADDVWVATEDLNGALDGDVVKVAVWQGSKRSGRKAEGEVKEIVERRRTEVVGTLGQTSPKFAVLTPDSRRLYADFYVPVEHLNGAKPGDKVILRVTQFPQNDKRAEGEVAEVLGKAGENNTEMHAILAEFGLPYHFPEAIDTEANAISEQISNAEIKKRRDFRNITTFTIDPADAKDFDDALSIEFLDGGHVRVGVHIADVTHYVRPNTLLEKEASQRATSVYLVDRTVPMLPEKLSNNLCSLRPHEDKLTFSAVFELTPDAKIVNEWIGRTIIHSDHRFSYEEAQDVLVAPTPTGGRSYQRELTTLNTLAKKLRDERFAQGAVNFETVEVRFNLDETGKPLGIYQKVRQDAHKLIEEFMLLANKRVAEFVFNLKKEDPRNTMVYRIHEAPDLEKLNTFAKFAQKLGYKLKVDSPTISRSLNHLLESVEGKPEQNVIESLAIRTMAKARYSTDAVGHFGLAFDHYSHFTSPIRRYPDMMAHRLLQHYLDGGKPADRLAYEAQCKHSSEREKMAAEAERASIKYKQVEFMSQMLGEEFDGLITGVTDFGIFVEITETACEGMVKMSDLKDDFYELDKENYRMVGKRSGRVFTFGAPVRVRVKETNLARRSMDLELVGMTGSRQTSSRSREESSRRGKSSAMPRGKGRERATRRR